MAVLFKLVMSGTTTTSANPLVKRYFYETTVSNQAITNFTIAKANFKDDNNQAATTSWTTATASGYYNLFINGVLQQSTIASIDAGGMTLQATTGTKIAKLGSPIVLQVTNFTPSSTTTVVS